MHPTQGRLTHLQWGDPEVQWPGHVPPSPRQIPPWCCTHTCFVVVSSPTISVTSLCPPVKNVTSPTPLTCQHAYTSFTLHHLHAWHHNFKSRQEFLSWPSLPFPSLSRFPFPSFAFMFASRLPFPLSFPFLVLEVRPLKYSCGKALWAPSAGSGTELQPKSNTVHFSLNMTSGGNNCNYFSQNQLTKFAACGLNNKSKQGRWNKFKSSF